MSDEKGQQEPSMEDILASIRRILSEDEVEEEAPAKASATAPAPAAPAPKPEPVVAEEDILELDESMVMDEPEPAPAAETDIFDLDDQGDAAPAVEPENDTDFDAMFESEPAKEARPMFAANPLPMAAELEREAGGLLAPAVAEASTAALSELARAVARERGVGLGARGITLEDMVRDILRPVLKDWLDQNLPYMVERIVRKEIERMVNRAERS